MRWIKQKPLSRINLYTNNSFFSMELLTTKPLIPNPIEYLARKKKQRLEGKYFTEDKFFRLQWDAINQSEYLKLRGYDAPFMEQEETLNALQQRLDQNPEFYIEGIVSTQDKISTLEELSRRNQGRIKLFEEPEQRKKGYIIFGGYGATLWDSTRLTKHPIERKQGVIRRRFSNHYLSISSIAESSHNYNFEKIRIALL